MTRSVLLTRPQGANTRLASLLHAAGISTIEHPLLSIEPLNPGAVPEITDLDLYDIIIFISANAVEFGLPLLLAYWPQWPVKLTWLSVGKGTSDRLAQRGIKAEFPDPAGSEELLKFDVLQSVSDQRVLIVRGQGGRETLKDSLSDRGARVDYLEVYRRVPASLDGLADQVDRVDVAIVTSVESLETFFTALPPKEVVKLPLIVPSQRIAEVAKMKGFAEVLVADGASDEALRDQLIQAGD